jgi:hypothetical protein
MPMQDGGFSPDFLGELLGHAPEVSFFSFVNQQQGPQQRFFQNQFQQIQNQFLGQLGSQMHPASALLSFESAWRACKSAWRGKSG